MELADKAQHVVLASATFDVDGRLMVTQDGLLPSREITKKFNQKARNRISVCPANRPSLLMMSSTLAIPFFTGSIDCPSTGLLYQTL
jgi:hypothetical protein